MLHPSHLDTVYKRFDKMKYDPKRIRKYYHKLLTTYGRKCRMKVGKYFIEWDKGISLVDELLWQTMKMPHTFSEGNIFIIGSFIDNFILYLNEMNSKISTINNSEILDIAHEQILEKQKEMIDVLIENVKNPVKLDELDRILSGRI